MGVNQHNHSYQQASYSIGVVSRLTGISIHCLRTWERRHGLGSSRRTPGGQREYNKVDLDHLAMIKQLVDSGMRIKDIASLPQKTLTVIANNIAAETNSCQEPLQTVIIGKDITTLLKQHRNRYPSLSVEFPTLPPKQWLLECVQSSTVQILIIQLTKIDNMMLKHLIQIRQRGCSVFIVGHITGKSKLEQLANSGIDLLVPPVDLGLLDKVTAKAKKQQAYISNLHDSSREFNVPLPFAVPNYFTDEALTEVAKKTNAITCKCPSHLSELIRSLNTFEQYSQQCGANSWKEASIHACIYAYTTQARNLMEKALLAAIDEDGLEGLKLDSV